MTENSPVPPVHQPSGEQLTEAPSLTTKFDSPNPLLSSKKRSILQKFTDAFVARKTSEGYEPHALYMEYEPWAKSVKIVLQMFIGIILGFTLLIKVIADVCHLLGNPLLVSLANQNPLNIVAYGLFFSTGVDLAYMLFTDGPDEAIDPLMTGLAAAILLGIGQIDYKQIQIQHGLILFLAVGALAGLFAIKKYLYLHLPDEKKTK